MRTKASASELALFAERLTKARQRAGLSQMEMSTALGYRSYTNVRKWEGAESLPASESIAAICRVLDVCPGYLLGLSDDPRTCGKLGHDHHEREARRYAQACERLASGRKRNHARYSGGWHASGDEALLVGLIPAKDDDQRLAELVIGWHSDHLIDVTLRDVLRWEGLDAVLTDHDLTSGELRWLCGHVSPDAGADAAQTVDSGAWWFEHLRTFRAELERASRDNGAGP